MAVTSDILRTYTAPRVVMRRLLAEQAQDDRPEARSLIYLLAGCFIIFVSQVPGLLALEMTAPDAPPREALIGITLFGWLIVWPLLFYLIAGASHVVARLTGGQGTFARARLALFWTVLAVSPLTLLRGMVQALIGPGAQLQVTEAVVALAFFAIWAISLWMAERPEAE